MAVPGLSSPKVPRSVMEISAPAPTMSRSSGRCRHDGEHEERHEADGLHDGVHDHGQRCMSFFASSHGAVRSMYLFRAETRDHTAMRAVCSSREFIFAV
jgi:hypothetical protein